MITINKRNRFISGYLEISVICQLFYINKTAANQLLSNLPATMPNIECEIAAVRELKEIGFDVTWDKANWRPNDWEKYTDENCAGCMNFFSSGVQCENPFHKHKVK